MTRLWRWYRAGLRDAGPDRVFRALRLHRNRHRDATSPPAFARGQDGQILVELNVSRRAVEDAMPLKKSARSS